jgi:hypothetical protein
MMLAGFADTPDGRLPSPAAFRWDLFQRRGIRLAAIRA